MAVDDDDITEDPRFSEALDKALAKREEEAKKKKERSKAFSDTGDALDRIADAVWDRFEERRAGAKPKDDEEPDRVEHEGGGGFLRMLGGG